MVVLYKELSTFAQIATYLAETELSVICANVAISCAIHDQNLDETMDITGKTTTNIDPQDFCKEQLLGDFFSGNQDHFDQYRAICFLKDNFFYVRKAYNLLTDDTSKNNFIALILFFLCPYTERFFTLTKPPETPFDFPTNTLQQLKAAKEELSKNPRTLTLPLGESLSDFAKLPFFLGKIGKLDSLTLQLCEGSPYFCVLTAEFQSVSVPEEPKPPLTESELPVPEKDNSETATVSTAPSETIPTFLENTPVFTPSTEPLEVEPETTPQEAQILQEMLADIDVPKPTEAEQPEALGVSEVVEEVVKVEEVEKDEAVEKVVEVEKEVVVEVEKEEAVVEIENIEKIQQLPDTTDRCNPQELDPFPSGILIKEEQLLRSLELLGTMEELVIYLHRQYPTDDPVCADLLNSMLTAVKTLRNTLS